MNMHDMNRREREALDRHITGNYGEDQIREAIEVETARVTIEKVGGRAMVLEVPAYTMNGMVLYGRILGVATDYLQVSRENKTGASLADFGFYCLARAAMEDAHEVPR